MSLQTRLGDLVTAIATDYKQLRTWITGSSSGTLSSLNTTDKASLVAAINEVKAGSSGAPPVATETVAGIGEIATLAEVAAGVAHDNHFVTPAGVRQERDALKAELLGGADAAWDTLNELKTFVDQAEESSVISALTTTVGQKADSSTVYTKAEIGNPETDLAAAYAAAKQ